MFSMQSCEKQSKDSISLHNLNNLKALLTSHHSSQVHSFLFQPYCYISTAVFGLIGLLHDTTLSKL